MRLTATSCKQKGCLLQQIVCTKAQMSDMLGVANNSLIPRCCVKVDVWMRLRCKVTPAFTARFSAFYDAWRSLQPSHAQDGITTQLRIIAVVSHALRTLGLKLCHLEPILLQSITSDSV